MTTFQALSRLATIRESECNHIKWLKKSKGLNTTDFDDPHFDKLASLVVKR